MRHSPSSDETQTSSIRDASHFSSNGHLVNIALADFHRDVTNDVPSLQQAHVTCGIMGSSIGGSS